MLQKISKTHNSGQANMNLFEHKQLQHIHILIISHRYGQSITAFISEKAALNGPYEYASEWWDETLDKQHRPIYPKGFLS